MTTRRKCRAGCTDPRPLSGSGSATSRACIRSHLRATNNAGAGACVPAFRSAPAASMPVRCAPDRKSIDRPDSSRSSTRFDSLGRQRPPSLSLSLSRHASRERSLGPFSARFEFQSLVSHFLFSFLLFSRFVSPSFNVWVLLKGS